MLFDKRRRRDIEAAGRSAGILGTQPRRGTSRLPDGRDGAGSRRGGSGRRPRRAPDPPEGARGRGFLPAPAAAAATIPKAPEGGAKPAPGRTPNQAPLPKVLRSQQALAGATLTTSLPITQDGTTYEMAQEARWLDSSHFAVGRW